MTLSELAKKLAAEAADIAQATRLVEKLKARNVIEREAIAVIARVFSHPDLKGDNTKFEFYWKGDHDGIAALDYILLSSGDEQYALEFAGGTSPQVGIARPATLSLIVKVDDEKGEEFLITYRTAREFLSLAEFGALLTEYPDRPITREALSLESDSSHP